jgi:excinuclease UvrABC ATPase subunit
MRVIPVVVIEHNLDVIKTADWIIDLGPEGGDHGGEIIVEGSPETVAKNKLSYTGQYLKNRFLSVKGLINLCLSAALNLSEKRL